MKKAAGNSKTARGVAGASNAAHKPWRLNGGGLYPLYMRRTMDYVGRDTTRRMGRPPWEVRDKRK